RCAIDPSNGQNRAKTGKHRIAGPHKPVLPTSRFLIATACLTIRRTLPFDLGDPARTAVSARPPQEGASNDGDCSQIATYGVPREATTQTLMRPKVQPKSLKNLEIIYLFMFYFKKSS